jgi:hypothetical protein
MSYLECSVRLSFQLSVGGFMSYLGCSVRLSFQLFVGGLMSYLGCSVRLSFQLFVGGLMFCLCYLCCLYILVLLSNAYCVVFLFCFSSSGVPYVASFFGLSIFDCPFGFL